MSEIYWIHPHSLFQSINKNFVSVLLLVKELALDVDKTNCKVCHRSMKLQYAENFPQLITLPWKPCKLSSPNACCHGNSTTAWGEPSTNDNPFLLAICRPNFTTNPGKNRLPYQKSWPRSWSDQAIEVCCLGSMWASLLSPVHTDAFQNNFVFKW